MRTARIIMVAACAVLSWAAAAGAGETLTAMLAGIAEAAKLDVPIVGEGKAEIDGIKGKVEDHVVIVERGAADPKAPTSLLVTFEKAQTRMLSLGPSTLHLATSGKAKAAKPDDGVPPTSFSAEDFLPFRPERCAVTRIADMTDEQFTLLCEPKNPPSQYALMVFKFDRERSVPRQILYYK